MSTFSATGYILRQVTAGPSVVSNSNGGGDMLRSTYDTNGDGIVNDSERLAGQLASYYASAASVAAALANKADLVNGFIPTSQIPAVAITEFLGTVANQQSMLALIGQRGDWCNRSDESKAYVLISENYSDINSWVAINYPASPLLSVNGQTGTVVLGKADIDLGNVPNVDATNPVNIQTTPALQFVTSSEKSIWGAKQDALVNTIFIDVPLNCIITWTAGTAPSGATDHRISVYRLGNLVSFIITLDYATAGATMTSLTLSNIIQLPNPATNSNYAGPLMYVQPLEGRIMASSKSANAFNISPIWRVNPSSNGFEIITAPTFSSGSFRFVIIKGTYLSA